MRLRKFAFLVSIATVVACSSATRRTGFNDDEINATSPDGDMGNGGFGKGALSDIEVDPKNTTIFIDSATTPETPGTVTYKVTRGGKDLTADATFAIEDPVLGSFGGATFTSALALPSGKMGVSALVEATTPEGKGLARLTIVKLRKTGNQRDFFFIVPYQLAPTPQNDVLKFSTNIKFADVAFVMDTTGSMSGSISALKSAIQGTLMTQLQASIPNVGLAVVDFRDFTDGANVLRVRQRITTNLGLAQTAVAAMSAGGGGDGPEASLAALHHSLTGQANGVIPAFAPTVPGTWGGLEFRPGAVPVIVHIHDDSWHDPSGIATMANVTTAFTSRNAKFVNIADNGGPETQANTLSDATGSNVPTSAFGACSGGTGPCCTDLNGAGRAASGPGGTCRLNFRSQNGAGVSTSIVKGIQAIAVGSAYDVRAVASNDPANAKGVDATNFIKALRAMEEGDPTNGCPAMPARDDDGDGIKETFVSVTVGTNVCFEVIPATNTTVMPENGPQFFNAFIDVIGVQGNVKLDQRSVLFLVPPKDPGVN